MWPASLPAQAETPGANQAKARQILAETIQALGGPAWLNYRTVRAQVRIAKFFQGSPTDTFEATETGESGYKERIDLPRQHVVQIFSKNDGWEITYKGKKRFSQPQLEDHRRQKEHSPTVILRKWYPDPTTVLIDEGPSQVERRQTEKITLIDSANDTTTFEIDLENHLPLRLSYEWRDPKFHDKNIDVFAFDNYHRIDGIATPLTITHFRNGEVVHMAYLRNVQYNIALPRDFFDPDIAAAHLK